MAILQVLFSSCLLLLLRTDVVEMQAFGPIADVEIRLVGGSAPNEGRVTIRWSPDSPWIALCYTELRTAPAWQMCRRAGYAFACGYSEAGARRREEPSLVNATSEVWFVSGCFHTQDSIFEGGCSLQALEFVPGSRLSCSHSNELWLTCGYPGMPGFELQQVNQTYGRGGRLVQARCGPRLPWGALCRNAFYALKEGRVACRELGHADEALSYGVVTPEALAPRHRPAFTTLVDYGCTGYETSLTECQHYAWRDCTGYLTLECFTGVEGYNETGYLCGSKQLCGEQCHQQRHPINGSSDDTFHYCQCDDACDLFGDCCYDAADACGPRAPPRLRRGEFLTEDFGCVWPTGSRFTHTGYAAVDRCPAAWSDRPTRDLCEGPAAPGDVIGSLLVHDELGVDFKNVHCAVCNGRTVDGLTPWDVAAAGSEMNPRVAYHASLGVYLPVKGWVVTPPAGHAFVRECPAHLVDTCLEAFSGSSLEEGCKAYYAPVKIGNNDVRFRNPHCAMCNGNTVAPDSSCREQTCTRTCKPQHWIYNCSALCGPIDKIFTIEVLFDFRSSGATAGTSCPEAQIYDPFLDRCRVLTCAVGHRLVEGECVRAAATRPVHFGNSSETKCLSEALGTNLGSDLFTTGDLPGTQSLFLVLSIPAEVFDFEAAFDGAAEAAQNASRVEPALLCNISKLSILVPFPFNGSNFCSESTASNIPVYNGTLLNAVEYENTGGQYTKSKTSPVCLDILGLNCSSLLSLDRSEYTNLSDGVIRIAATGSSLSPGEFVLFPDGAAVVCSFLGPAPDGWEPRVRRVISFVGSCLSLFALAATFLTYCVFAELRNPAGILVMNLVGALFAAVLLFLVPGYLSASAATCVAGAAAAHFAWLAAFAFMAAVAVSVERTLTSLAPKRDKPPGIDRTLAAYLALGWGLPLLVVGACLALHHCRCTRLPGIYAGGAVCWITDGAVRAVAFGLPVGLGLAVSTALYLLTLVRLRRRRRATRMVRKRGRAGDAREEVAIYSKLCVLMGVTWVFGFVSQSVTGIAVFSYVHILLNYLQGVFIFAAFCLNRRVRGLWRQKLRGGREVGPRKGAASGPREATKETDVSPAAPSVSASVALEEDTKL